MLARGARVVGALLVLALCGGMAHRNLRGTGHHWSWRRLISGQTVMFLPSIASTDECTGSSLSLSDGTAVTYTRAGSATCTKSDGTVVTLGANQPRVQGTGLLVEGSATNLAFQSQTLEQNAQWGAIGTGAPTVTANAAVAPDGTTTAERLDFGAVSAGNFGDINQNQASFGGATRIFSGYVKGVSGSGTIYFSFLTSSSTWVTAPCAYTASAWTRCWVTGTSLPAGSTYAVFGVDTRAGNPPSAAQSVYAWGFQVETSQTGLPTTYIATVATSATRNADSASFTPPTFAGATGPACVAASFNVSATVATQRVIGSNGGATALFLNSLFACGMYDTVSVPIASGSSFAGSTTRCASSWDASTMSVTYGSATTSSAYNGTGLPGSTVYLGSQAGSSNFLWGTVGNVVFGNSRGLCN